MGDVTKLKIAGAPISTKEQMAEALRKLADRVAEGEFGEVDRMVTVLHSFDHGVIVKPEGDEHFATHATVGLLEMAKYTIIE